MGMEGRMFDTLTERLDGTFKKLRSRGKLHPKQIDNALGDMRTALLEADVSVEVADDFLARVRVRALSEEVTKSLTPGQQVVKVVNEELTATMGGEHTPFELGTTRPVVIMMAGVQGSGKTTACAKLAFLLKQKGKRPLLVADDLERPAAVEQLRTLGREIGVPVWSEGRDPVKLAKASLREAERQNADVVIIDTAGRLHVDPEMMKQARRIKEATKPQHVLMACDAMTGQDAVIQARAFMGEVDTTGFILTKLDGDARGGAALSIVSVTGKPIKFVGVGEKVDKLEVFHPDRMASRILGMGDMLGLIEKAESASDLKEAGEMARKLRQAEFTLDDFKKQLVQLKKMGSLSGLLGHLPGTGVFKKLAAADIDDRRLVYYEAIINSMTPAEREDPRIINGSRRQRIARGSGRPIHEVNQLLKQFQEMQRMMKGGTFKKMLGGLK